MRISINMGNKSIELNLQMIEFIKNTSFACEIGFKAEDLRIKYPAEAFKAIQTEIEKLNIDLFIKESNVLINKDQICSIEREGGIRTIYLLQYNGRVYSE